MMIIFIAIGLVELQPFRVKPLAWFLLGANLPCTAVSHPPPNFNMAVVKV
jgi:hypothetical protein